MKKEDIEFLKQLKENIVNGNHVGQASPRFWMIMDYKEVPVPYGYGGELKIFCEDSAYTLEDFKKKVVEDFMEDEFPYQFDFDIEKCNDLDDIYDVMKEYDFDTSNYGDCVEVYMKKEGFISTKTGAFLTLEDAERHLKNNHYNYDEQAHPYALTALRNPTFEKLLNIIIETDWEKENEE